MNNNDRINLIHRISEIEGLSDKERSALLGLLRESKTYGLVWEDKPEAVEERLRDELPVLTEVKERALISKDKDAPNHILIEGDNLEALTTLAYTHAGRIDVIYIDPPYNTGNKDFVYNDSFVDKEDSYRHSKWLSFMSRRLKIAKQLLSDKGVIFISIDDNEQAQLKLLCDEVFGEGNFIENIIWQKKFSRSNDATYFSSMHDHILCYVKSTEKNIGWEIGLLNRTEDIPKGYSNPDNDYRGPWTSVILSAKSGSDSLLYKIITPSGRECYPPSGRYWSCSKETFDKWRKENRIWFGKDGNGTPRRKTFLSEVQDGLRPNSILFQSEAGNNQEARQELKNIFNGEGTFDNPKPIKLLKLILTISNSKKATILDFFAGSGTTLHATMQLNAEDGGHRQCILVTNNENGICENVTYERNKRVIQGYTTPKGEHVAGLTNNNLRYYRTGFVSRNRSVQNMRRLVNLSTDMLCIKEDLYTEQPTFCGERAYKGIFRYFDDGQKQMLVIYREEAIDRLVELIYGMDVKGKIKIYVFSPSEDPWEDSFEDVSDKVELCALPAAIYNAYHRILPKKKDVVVLPEADAPVTNEKENQTDGMLNFTDEGDEA
ncbi:site-specific DNA-methyltransferase [Mediterranea sp. An20]|uniref:site-specific DNA-methyltransferase n=1 Tax=Mediterranea sp. An20 TaxID=1965586 RepID=UPI000B36DB89|nr:site-specific DNA-methyltransferase [Mediterranea sp. An20]OUP05867.1 site-specific DNA-methyltransferase [Mediterranea sp. An20]